MHDLSPVLKIGTTLAFLSSRGKTPSLIEELISAVRGFTKFLEHCLAIEIGNPSHPALELLSDLIISDTSRSDTSSITILFGTFLT